MNRTARQMNRSIGPMEDVSDELWEEAAVEQLRADVRAYPGGAQAFVKDNRERLGVGYDSFNDNLNRKNRISYRTFTRALLILGYTPQEYDDRIMTRVEMLRRTSLGE